MNKQLTDEEINDLAYSPAYADYLMSNAHDMGICNGDRLLEVMESMHMFDQFLATLQKDES